MKSQLAILAACCLLTACVDDWFGSDSVGVDRSSNDNDTSVFGAAKAPIIEQAEYIESIQSEATIPQANLTGTWLLLSTEVAEGAFELAGETFPYNTVRNDITTVFIIQNGNQLNVQSCIDDTSEDYILSDNNTISPALIGYNQLSIKENRVITFNNRFSTYEDEVIDEITGLPYLDKGQVSTYGRMIKLDPQVRVPMAILAQGGMETELDCVDAFKVVTEETRENNVYLDHRFATVDIDGNTYLGEGRNTRDGGIVEGDPEYTYSENQYQVILNGLSSTVTITD